MSFLSVHRGGISFPACITGHMTRGSASRGSLHPGGLPPGGGLHPRGSAFIRVEQTPSPRETWDTARYGQQADGMHPTGMHSCL